MCDIQIFIASFHIHPLDSLINSVLCQWEKFGDLRENTNMLRTSWMTLPLIMFPFKKIVPPFRMIKKKTRSCWSEGNLLSTPFILLFVYPSVPGHPKTLLNKGSIWKPLLTKGLTQNPRWGGTCLIPDFWGKIHASHITNSHTPPYNSCPGTFN